MTYLRNRAAQVGQKTLDIERQAIQAMMVNITGQLPLDATLPVARSVEPQRPRHVRLLRGRQHLWTQLGDGSSIRP